MVAKMVARCICTKNQKFGEKYVDNNKQNVKI